MFWVLSSPDSSRLISGIFQRELGQSVCRWSQHLRVSDSQPWEPDCAAVLAALGAARWKRIPRGQKHSSEGTLLARPFIVHAECGNCPFRSALYQFLSSSNPVFLCHPLILLPLTSSSLVRILPSNQYIDRWCKARLYHGFNLHLIKQWSRKNWILNGI